MEAWFPQLKQTKVEAARLRVVAFPNAGSSENVYTGMDKTAFGGKTGRRENELVKWAKATKVELWAVQPPGRDARMKEAAFTTARSLATAVFDVMQKESDFFESNVPFAVLGHSMGTWCAYEFVKLCLPRKPTVLVVSGFPGPFLAAEKRPWTPQASLPEKEAFQNECRQWNINEVIFGDGMWAMYEKLLRADFRVFDEYPETTEKSSSPLEVPVRALYGSKDKRCTRDLVETWQDVSSDFHMLSSAIEGHHLFLYDEIARCDWFLKIIGEAFEPLQPPMLFECVAPKGAALRQGCELTTSLMSVELVKGNVVKVAEERKNLKGTDRLKIVSFAAEEGAAFEALNAWGSKKLFTFLGFDKASSSPSSYVHDEETKVEPPPPPVAAMPTTGELYVVTGKAGAMLRAGCELETADLNVTLDAGTACYVVELKPNKKGALRARVGRYALDGSWRAIDGWCTAKFLEKKTAKKEPLPAEKTGVRLFAGPSGKGHVFLFPGQGAQKVGMMTPYLDAPGVASMFRLASSVFDGEDLLKIIQEGPVEKLNDTRYSQVCVFLTSLAAVKKLEAEDPDALAKADACAGFSLGEYTALAFAGVIDLKTGVTLLKLRGEAMASACEAAPVATGMLTVVGVDDAPLAELMKGGNVTVANQLFPKGRVLSGPKEELSALEEKVKALKIDKSKTIVQPVSGAFHSKYMQPAADQLQLALADAQFAAPTRLVYSNVTARPHEDAADSIKQKMAEQLTAGVLWEDTIHDMASRLGDVAKFFEPQPGKQLASMMRRINPDNQPKMNAV